MVGCHPVRAACLACLAATVLAVACTRHPTGFSTNNARAHLRHLAGHIGPRPAGTEANARARSYVATELTRIGLDVRIQATEARRREIGLSGWVHNVIAVLPGRRAEAIGIVAHYDSVAESPGASDDALGVAVALEAARAFAAHPARQWTLMVLLSDAEEDGLLGAAALVGDAAVRTQLMAYINMDSTGGDSPVVVFETGPNNGWLTSVWARAAPHPRGSSYFYEVYRRMGNDTDFSIFKQAGIPGLNVAAVGDTYGYHSALDSPRRVTDRAIRDMGDTVVSVVDALQHEDITRRTGSPSNYFDLAGLTAVTWQARTNLVLLVVTAVLGLVAMARALRDLWARGGAPALFWTVFWTLAGAAVVFGCMTAAVAVLRGTREVYQPWYAHPGRLMLLLAMVATTSAWVLIRIAASRLRWQPPRAASAVWAPTLAVWTALGIWLARAADAAAFMVVIPLLLAAAPLALGGFRQGPVMAASALAAGAAALLWPRDVILFASLLPSLLGGAGIVTPTWVFPSLAAALAVMLAPPILSLFAATRLPRPPFATRALMLVALLAFAWSFSAPSYTAARPLRVTVGQLTTLDDGGSTEVVMSSSEPIIEFGATAPLLVPGMPVSADLRRLVRGTFVATGRVAPEPPPATVLVTAEPAADGAALRVRVHPARPGLFAAIRLPAGITPLRSTLPGIVSQGRWRALYAAVPAPEGLDCLLVFAPADAARAREGQVLLQVPGQAGGGTTAIAHPVAGSAVMRDQLLWFQWPLR